MSQVIGNIIHNSYKYADTKIDVGFKVVENNLEMRIRDYGPGVPDSEIELITNKFYRGKAQSESGAEGSVQCPMRHITTDILPAFMIRRSIS